MHRLLLPVSLLLLAVPSLHAEDWPSWRGALGTGYSSDNGFPLTWSASENVKWKVKLAGPGNSTPVVMGKLVFVSCASREGHRRSLLCLDREAGNTLWEQHVEYAAEEPTHEMNPYCSSSPATDGERVVVWHGSAGLYAYDNDGTRLWHQDLGRFDHIWGNGSSPLIYQDLVILNCGPGLRSFLLALDKRTGEERWRRVLPGMASQKIDDFVGSWSSPVLAPHGGQDLVLISLPSRLYAIDPLTGNEVWSCDGLGKLIYTSPLVSPEAIVAMSGYQGPALAVKPGGKGDVTATHRLWWQNERPPQRIGSGLIVGKFIYVLNEPGIAWCMEVQTGEILWKHRLSDATSWSSMCYADGRIYINDMSGTTYVLEPAESECTVLAKNALGERMRASLAFSQGQIFARTYQYLYCIESTK